MNIKLNQEFLYQEYIINRKSISQIGKEISCNRRTVSLALKNTNIPIRDIGDQNIINLTNKQFGYFKVLELDTDRNKDMKFGTKYWRCLCTRCNSGKIISLRSDSIRAGRIKSCGCLLRKAMFGEITGEFWNHIIHHAKHRNIEFSITIEYAWNLFLKQERKCGLSGIELLFFLGRKNRNKITASLDRIDNSKAYIEGNVWWIHKDLNTIKWDYSVNDLFSWIKKIYEHNQLNLTNL